MHRYVFLYFLVFLLLFFIIKFVLLSFSFLWVRIKFPQQNINQSETRTGDKKLSMTIVWPLRFYDSASKYLSVVKVLLLQNEVVSELENANQVAFIWRLAVSSAGWQLPHMSLHIRIPSFELWQFRNIHRCFPVNIPKFLSTALL